MKQKIVIILDVLLLLSGCGGQEQSDTNTSETNKYEYIFRDLPDIAYKEIATFFAGGDGKTAKVFLQIKT